MNNLISLIIPAYNEEYRLASTLEKITEYVKSENLNTEIIVVDDGSVDNTSLIASKFPKVIVITQPRNMGKGAAVRTGMLAAKGDFRIFSDADLSTPIYELSKILKNLNNGFDVCIGSRAIDSSLIKVHQPFYREYMGKSFNKIVQLLVVKGIKDTQCGFKGFSSKAAIEIFSKSKKNGFRIKEIPVEWYNDERSKVDPIKDSIKMILEIFKIRKIHS
jgi:dolichyl-phosphate beta-glucosyltransferase